MHFLTYCVFIFAICSCTMDSNQLPKDEISNINQSDTITDVKVLNQGGLDTVIHYGFYGQSAQGGEAIVNYKSGIIDSANVVLYGETTKAIFNLKFTGDSIKITECLFEYLVQLEEVKSNDDMTLISQTTYNLKFDFGSMEAEGLEDGIEVVEICKSAFQFVLN